MDQDGYLTQDYPIGVLHPAVAKMNRKRKTGRQTLRRVIETYGLRCLWCDKICNPELHPHHPAYPTKEHIIRRVDGGTDCMGNMAIACRKCNTGRHHKRNINDQINLVYLNKSSSNELDIRVLERKYE